MYASVVCISKGWAHVYGPAEACSMRSCFLAFLWSPNRCSIGHWFNIIGCGPTALLLFIAYVMLIYIVSWSYFI